VKEPADILFMSANPAEADLLELDREARAIQRAIEDGCPPGSDELRVATRWAQEPLGLLREIRAIRPAVLHFAGYGDRGGGGIYLQRENALAALVSSAALAETVRAAGSSIRLVVFNACYAVDHAAGLLDTVDCVVGVRGAIGELGARAFALAFYAALAAGCSVGEAWARASSAPAVLGDSNRADGRPALELRVRAGVDADLVYVGRRRGSRSTVTP
jgi:hypothetical protein